MIHTIAVNRPGGGVVIAYHPTKRNVRAMIKHNLPDGVCHGLRIAKVVYLQSGQRVYRADNLGWVKVA